MVFISKIEDRRVPMFRLYPCRFLLDSPLTLDYNGHVKFHRYLELNRSVSLLSPLTFSTISWASIEIPSWPLLVLARISSNQSFRDFLTYTLCNTRIYAFNVFTYNIVARRVRSKIRNRSGVSAALHFRKNDLWIGDIYALICQFTLVLLFLPCAFCLSLFIEDLSLSRENLYRFFLH